MWLMKTTKKLEPNKDPLLGRWAYIKKKTTCTFILNIITFGCSVTDVKVFCVIDYRPNILDWMYIIK